MTSDQPVFFDYNDTHKRYYNTLASVEDNIKTETYKDWRRGYLLKHTHLLLGAVVISMGLVALQLLSPVPIKILFDNVFGGETLTWMFSDRMGKDLLAIVAVLMLVIVVLREVYTVAQDYIFRIFTQIIDRSIMGDVFNSVNQIPEGTSERKKPGEYVFAITNESQQMSQLILVNVVTIIGAVITIVVISLLMWRIDSSLMLAALAVFPPAIGFVYIIGGRLEENSDKTEKSHAKVFQFVNENVQKIRLIQSFALERVQLGRLKDSISVRNKNAKKQTLLLGSLSGIDEVVLAVATAAVIYIGGNGVFDGDVKIGELLLFVAYLDFLYAPFAMIVDAVGSAKEQNASLKRVFEVVTSSKQLALDTGTDDASRFSGLVEFRDVQINYANESVVEHVNLRIEPGEFVALIGPSGSGKSSLLDSIVRFVPIAGGNVFLDSIPVNQFSLTSLRENIAMVDQEADLMDLSLGDNISVHWLEKDNKLPDIMKGAAFAELVDFVETSDDKYDRMIDGVSVSGGQKQRVGLARAYYKEAQIIVMDEPTSALDKVTAEKIRENITNYMAGRTRIVVTHDLDLIKNADRVFLVRDKTIREVTGAQEYKEMLN